MSLFLFKLIQIEIVHIGLYLFDQMEILLLSVIAFIAAILTFFSGFGLGTILTPVFMLFFPVETAIALTGVVHFTNNIFKLFLVGNRADIKTLIRFGIPAVIGSFIGAWLLLLIPDRTLLFSYTLLEHTFQITPLKFLISLLLLVFATMELIPFLNRLKFGKNVLPLGGFLSGFFGGLSGNQGALRSAFLIKAGLSKDKFIGTVVVISGFVDFTRLSVYATRYENSALVDNLNILLIPTLSAIAGSFIGNRLLKKVTFHFVQVTVAILLIILSIALGAGLL